MTEIKHFKLKKTDSSGARRGTLETLHGTIETPIFMPVGTQGTVKGLLPDQVESVGAQIILGNTYHLNLRPTSERIAELGGLHNFMGWKKPILTDSGGFQVFSLAKLRKISEKGIRFQSHFDGREVWLDPQRVIDIQVNLGSDIAMVLDECPPADCSEKECALAVDRTLRWAREARDYAAEIGFLQKGHHVFGIVQGGRFQNLRETCARELVAMDFPGYAIGGVSVGEPESEMLPQVAWSTAILPVEKPRYVMGVGTPPQLLKMIKSGADMFDCVMPTREARHGIAYTDDGRINIKNSSYKDDPRPLMERFETLPNGKFSRAYIRHLFTAGEMAGGVILSIHNLNFFLDLMAQARLHIEAGDYETWHIAWIERYLSASQSTL